MNDTNLVILTGGVTQEVDLKYSQKGTSIANINLAVTGSFKQGNEWKDRVDYFYVTVFGKTAENCKEYLVKGSQILVEGSLRLEQWEKDGKKQSKVGIIANKVQFLSKPKGDKKQAPPVETLAKNMIDSDGDEIPF